MKLFSKMYNANDIQIIKLKNDISYNTTTKLFLYNKVYYNKFEIVSLFTKQLNDFEKDFEKYSNIETKSEAQKWLIEESLKKLELNVSKIEEYLSFIMADGNIDNCETKYFVKGIIK